MFLNFKNNDYMRRLDFFHYYLLSLYWLKTRRLPSKSILENILIRNLISNYKSFSMIYMLG